MRRAFWSVLGGVHILLITLYNVSALADHLRFSGARVLHEMSTTIRHSPAVWYYSQFAGLQGGYGFYSPSVGNLYSTEFGIATGATVYYQYDPDLHSLTGSLRYRSFLDIASAWVDNPTSTEALQFAEAVGISLSRRLSVRHDGAQVHLQVITKQIPKLQQLTKNTADTLVRYIQLYHYETEVDTFRSVPAIVQRPRAVTSLGDATSVAGSTAFLRSR